MKNIRISIAAIVFVLICLGIIMIYSSSGVFALEQFGDKMYFLKKQLTFVVIGGVAMTAVMAMDYRCLQKYSKFLLLFVVFLLVIVLIPGIGKSSFGARRWLGFSLISFQPSELAKLAMIIYTADFLSRKKRLIRQFKKGFLPLMIILGVVCFFVVIEPDLGNTVLIAGIVMLMIFVAGARMKHLGLMILSSFPFLYYLIAHVPFRRARILSFMNPWSDSQGIGFQLTQSQIALGSGGLTGVGLGQSHQKLFYLPAAHTDFIFSIVGEEMGLLGTLSVVVLFILLIWQGARIVKRVEDPFGYFLSLGILAMLSLQAVVNIGVSIGAVPTKGLPLPFISYGGSALVFNMVAIGLLLNVSRTQEL